MILVIGSLYYYREPLINFGKQQFNLFKPCSFPITYSIGNFDEKFSINKTKFLSDINRAEKIWETEAHKELFQYIETGGTLTVNLTYDERQATTDKLREIGIVISNNKESYNALEAKYNALTTAYEQQKEKFERDAQYLERIKNEYEKEVTHWNNQWGAPKDEYKKLQEKRAQVNALVAHLNKSWETLNNQADMINSLAVAINQLISELNLNVKKYNTTSGENGEEFDEGEYVRDTSGERINIYQFSNDTKLIRVLTHEFGHALWLIHVDDPRAIMYRLNQDESETLTEADITELTKICRLN